MGFQRHQFKIIQEPLIIDPNILETIIVLVIVEFQDAYLIILEINKMLKLSWSLMLSDFSVSSWFQNPHLPSFGILKTLPTLTYLLTLKTRTMSAKPNQ